MILGDEWRILSARYGLSGPSAVIAPYNETLNAMDKTDRREWAQRVLDNLRSILHPGDTVVFLAGNRYREFLELEVLKLNCRVSVPMRGLPIGKQLSWLGKLVAR
jgi:hypothetical protein